MDPISYIKTLEWTPLNIMKMSAVGAAVLVVFILFLNLIGSSMNPLIDMGVPSVKEAIMPGFNGAYDGADDYAYTSVAYESPAAYGIGGGATLSARNLDIMPPLPGGSVGGDAEDYEVTEYSVSIETHDADDTCSSLLDLKKYDYVVFESSNAHERGCNYVFKVETAKADEVRSKLESYDPKELSENIYTIKRQLDDFTSETEILERKLDTINSTLDKAVSAYDEITALALRTQNADSLAKIIDSKLSIVERLTQERINVTAQLDRLTRSKEEQLDRLTYTYFYVNVFENKFIDVESLKESWKSAVSTTARTVNTIIQELTLGLVSLLFFVIQWVIYILLTVLIGKYLWRAAKHIWSL